ncbi:outer dense fiber protein 3 [Aplysia californica]|uniref:Outer dense fiber protein 3 n=1 Tax=Aplysia californica TaxID=6500 RepID=A0ABM1VXL7_APLCA|nr:outer dense fiber protein 3 [Aplysia californica]
MTKTRVPGPKYTLPPLIGTNNHDPTREKAPGYSMAGKRTYSYGHSPGPYYFDSGITNRGRVNNSGFTLLGRPKHSIWGSSSSSPGPSSSNDYSQTEPSSPRYSFGLPRKINYNNGGPGPNSYYVPSGIGQGRKATIYGRDDKRGFAYDYAKSPGPSYNYGNATYSGGPAYTMGMRTKRLTNKTVTPGPDYYFPTVNGTAFSSPRFSMGIRHHEDVMPLADVSD